MNILKPLSLMAASLFLVACSTIPTGTVEGTVKDIKQTTKTKEKQKITPVDTSVKSSSAVQSLLTTAYTQAQSGDQVAAIGTLQRAIRIAPRFPESYLRLAEIKYEQGDYTQARSLAKKAVSLGATDEILSQSKRVIENTL